MTVVGYPRKREKKEGKKVVSRRNRARSEFVKSRSRSLSRTTTKAKAERKKW
jgi:hypothetical protein